MNRVRGILLIEINFNAVERMKYSLIRTSHIDGKNSREATLSLYGRTSRLTLSDMTQKLLHSVRSVPFLEEIHFRHPFVMMLSIHDLF